MRSRARVVRSHCDSSLACLNGGRARSTRRGEAGSPRPQRRGGGAGRRATRPHRPRRSCRHLGAAPDSAGGAANRAPVHSAACPRRRSPSSGRRAQAAAAAARHCLDRGQERRAARRRRPPRRARRRDPARPTPPTSRRPRPAGMEAGPLDRLRLTDARIAAMADGLRQVAALPTRSARSLDGWRPARTGSRSSGSGCRSASWRSSTRTAQRHQRRGRPLPEVGQRRAAAGQRPPRCARTSRSPTVLRDGLRQGRAPRRRGGPRRRPVATRPRSRSCSSPTYVDCLIPRGGPALIQSIRDNATVPVIIDGDGNCHVYVDAAADLDAALDIVVNAKTQRPSVCNAAESLVVHEAVADAFLPARRATRCVEQGVELVGDDGAPRARARDGRGHRRRLRPRVPRAQDERRRSCRRSTPRSTHVNRFGTGHTEAILTRDLDAGAALHPRGRRRPRWS